jgi:hypothetical protein
MNHISDARKMVWGVRIPSGSSHFSEISPVLRSGTSFFFAEFQEDSATMSQWRTA